MFSQTANWDYQWGQIVGRAWADGDFNQRLLADPVAVLKEYDLPPPAGLRIEVLEDRDGVPEDTDDVMHLILPGKPSAAELSEDDLCSVGDGMTVARCGCGGCHSCGRCGACGACAACVWCYHSPEPDEN
jgi:hypothetical protein